jgi:transposase InsO family protein
MPHSTRNLNQILVVGRRQTRKEHTANSIWIYDTTHFTRAGMAVLIIEALVSRKWLTEIVSVEETSVQVELAFTAALAAEGLLEAVEARHDDGRIGLGHDDATRPILLAVSDNGPQMTSGSTREFLAMCAIAQHFGRPGTPTDQAWIESLNGTSKPSTRTCWPSLIRRRCGPNWRSSEPATTRPGCTPASATSPPTTTRRPRRGHPQGPRGRPRAGPPKRLATHRAQREDRTDRGPADVA